MDTTPLAPRVLALIRRIRTHNPDVICLQELTERSFTILKNALCKPVKQPSKQPGSPDEKPSQGAQLLVSNEEQSLSTPVRYCMHCPPDWSDQRPYFNAMLTRHNLFDEEPTSSFVSFPASQMFRAYVHVCGTLCTGHKVSLITSHLESLSPSALRRKEQLAKLLDLQRDMVAEGRLTVFVGDTNLRETEVPAREIQKAAVKPATHPTAQRKKKPRTAPKFHDAWILAGSEPTHKFTWDTGVNDNLDGFDQFKPKSRYDRCFMLAPPAINVSVPDFQLVGKDRLPCGKFTSDHWGMLFTARFDGDP